MYDNVCKFLATHYKNDLATWLLGSPIELTELSPTELSNSLILLQSPELILHSEFQTDPENEIPFRMTDYRLRGHRLFPEKKMRQVVIYLRKTQSKLVYENSFKLENTYHQYEVIRLWEQPTELFMELPGLLPFAVLSKTPDPVMVLNQVGKIVEEMEEITLQRDIAAASSILAGLVLEKNIITKVFRSEIMRESVIYQEILQEGILQGKAEGKAEVTRKLTFKLLKMGMSLEQICQLTELPLKEVKALQKQMQKPNFEPDNFDSV